MMIMIREVQPRHNPCLSHVLSLIILADLAMVSVGYDDTVMTAKTGNSDLQKNTSSDNRWKIYWR